MLGDELANHLFHAGDNSLRVACVRDQFGCAGTRLIVVTGPADVDRRLVVQRHEAECDHDSWGGVLGHSSPANPGASVAAEIDMQPLAGSLVVSQQVIEGGGLCGLQPETQTLRVVVEAHCRRDASAPGKCN